MECYSNQMKISQISQISHINHIIISAKSVGVIELVTFYYGGLQLWLQLGVGSTRLHELEHEDEMR